MADFINTIKQRIKSGDILIKLISINICVFLILSILNVICTLFKLSAIDLVQYIGVPASLSALLERVWTVFTYMFTHVQFFHILFNMLLLYWFGQMFLSFFTPRHLGGLYILGGLGGAILYVIAFNTIPYYIDMPYSVMIGASASVMAVIFAAAFYRPQAEVGLLLLGRVKIIYIAVFFFLLDFLALGSPDNPGGHIAHIGGALVGYVFARQYLKGKDITAWMNRLIDGIVNLFKPKPKKMKVKVNKNKRTADYEYNEKKNKTVNDIDTILDKIKVSGYSSLSKEEKKKLFDASNK